MFYPDARRLRDTRNRNAIHAGGAVMVMPAATCGWCGYAQPGGLKRFARVVDGTLREPFELCQSCHSTVEAFTRLAIVEAYVLCAGGDERRVASG